MKPLSVLVVDDELLARETLTGLLEKTAEFELLGTCSDGREAHRRIRASRPDIVLLDIEMPGLRGIDLLAELPPDDRPAVVFVTAYADHALRAFELQAVDYLLKPFSDRRFFEVLAHAKRRVLERRMSSLALDLASGRAAAAPQPPEKPYLERIPIQQKGRKLLVPVREIRWIESDDYCVRLHTARGRFLLRGSLTLLEERLDPGAFVRVHRGAIVSTDAVVEIRPRPNGGRVLELGDGDLVPVARARVKAIESRLVPRLGG